MALTKEQLEELHAALGDAFDANGLEQLVRFKLGIKLNEIVNLTLGFNKVAFDLIEWAEQQGLTEALIRAVSVSRPDNPSVRAFVEKHFPKLKDPVQPEALIRGVEGGFTAIVQLLDDKNVRLIVGAFRAYFETTRSRVEILGKYKALHDRLHTLQVQFPRQIADAANNFQRNGAGAHPLDLYAYQLQQQAEKARAEAVGLPNAAEEEPWVLNLENVVRQIKKADADQDPVPLRQALVVLKRVLAEAPRINSLLAGNAAGLGLDKLIDAMGEIVHHLDAGGKGQAHQVTQVRAGLDGLRGLQPRLAGLVQEHFAWQWLDKEFAAAEAQPGGTAEERFALWDDVRTRLLHLCAVSPQRDWSQQLTRLTDELQQAGKAGTPDLFGRKFETFLTIARDRFFEVDVELLKLSGQLARVGESLDQLLRLATDD